TDGLQSGEQTIIAARPSVGKSAIAFNIVEHVCLRNHIPTLVVTLEMSQEAVLRRLMSSTMGVPLATLRSGQFMEADLPKVAEFKALLERSTLVIEEAVGGIDIYGLVAVVRKAVRRHGVKLVVVDYLQKVRPSRKHEKRTYEVGEVSEGLK